MRGNKVNSFLKIAFIGTYPPRKCGIATFTADLLTSIKNYNIAQRGNMFAEDQLQVVAMHKDSAEYAYGPEVCYVVREQDENDYVKAAKCLNLSAAEVVSVQHEYGIFGGDDGSYLLTLLGNLKKPVATTLHTVLEKPSVGQKRVLSEVAKLSSQVIVQAEKAVDWLHSIYGVPMEKIAFIPHGAPNVPFLDPYYYKEEMQVGDKKIILTFGLLGPNKGIEYMLKALPPVFAEHPNTLYYVLGMTHPEIIRTTGEQYRDQLQQMVSDLGLSENVVLVNEYISADQLEKFLLAADIYVTPYLYKEQMVSGTLAYAVAFGKAVVSTPYWHAEELLAEGRGVLVPFRDSEALTSALTQLLNNDAQRNEMGKAAFLYGRKMVWPVVAGRYGQIFLKASCFDSEHGFKINVDTEPDYPVIIPEVRLDHMRLLTDDTGLMQHAKFSIPDRVHGYCTDDNARALIVALMHWELTGVNNALPLTGVYLAFLNDALHEESGCVRNFMAYNRLWQEEVGSEDSLGRMLWALGYLTARAPDESLRCAGARLFRKALSGSSDCHSPRPLAFTILGALYYLDYFQGDATVRGILKRFSDQLWELFKENARTDWIWCEDTVTYDNARLPQALIMAGCYLEDQEMVHYGLKVLAWLTSVQTDPDRGHLTLIGSRGWLCRGGKKAKYDQQPLETAALVDAYAEAWQATGDAHWQQCMHWAFSWYFGHNDGGWALYDQKSGSCYDGLEPRGVNQNRGAESTLSFLLALHRIHLIQKSSLPPVAGQIKSE